MTLKRKDIQAKLKEKALEIPLDVLLTGKRNRNLTKKMQGFAVDLATGETKAQAYRNNYNSKGKPKTQGNEGSKLAKHPEIAKEVELITEALEAAAAYTAGQLRGLVIGRLTKEAVDMDSPAASRITALKALGQVSEIAAFTERKEIHQVNSSDDVRAQLLAMIQGAMTDQVRTIDHSDDDAAELLGMIQAANGNGQGETPPEADPHLSEIDGSSAIHTTPLKQLPSDSLETFPGSEGVGGTNSQESRENPDIGETPPSVSDTQG